MKINFKILRSLQLIIFINCFFISTASFGQKESLFKAKVTAGLNLAQIDGDGPIGYSYFGGKAGLSTYVFVYEKTLSLGVGINYSMRGSKTNQTLLDSGLCAFTQRTGYIEIPVILSLHDRDRAVFNIGIVPSVLSTAKLDYESLENPTKETPACLNNEFSSIDISITGGMYFLIKSRFGVGPDFTYSLKSVRPPCERFTTAGGQFHNVIGINAFYVLGKF